MLSGSQSESPSTRPRPSDFKFGKEIGQGSFSSVYVAKEISNDKQYAVKVIDKQHVLRNKAVESVMMEKEVLKRTSHEFIIRLYSTFQDAARLYFLLDYAPRGELLTYLNQLTSLDTEGTKFYAAELLVALGYLHSLSIVHRDVKPENVLLTETMHIKLCDFGSAIILDAPHIKAPTFTGTPQYVSPEMLSSSSSNPKLEVDNGDLPESYESGQQLKTDLYYLMDYWAFGCVIYQMLAGRPPFRRDRATNEYEIFQKILSLSYSFVEGFDKSARDLVERLLVLNPADRLGSPCTGGPDAIREHAFFSGIQWTNLSSQYPPCMVPNVEPMPHDGWDDVPVGFEAGQKYHLTCELGMAASQVTEHDRSELLRQQQRNNPFHRFVRGRLIIKQGVLFKRRGLFARKRMFLLTEGPHLFYVDMEAMVLKGEVPWSNFLKVEMRNSKIFSIHVPNRIFYLEDPTGHSAHWIEKLKQVKAMYYTESAVYTPAATNQATSSSSGTVV